MVIQIRKKPAIIVDFIWSMGRWPRFKKRATCFCLRHLKIWPEGDYWEGYGGKACKKCTS